MRVIADCKVDGNKVVLSTQHFVKLEDGKYEVEFRDLGKSRSLSQNAMLWGIIGEISRATSGGLLDENLIYVQLLEMTGAKYTDIEIVEEAYEDFKSMVKYTRVLGRANGKLIVRTFGGSSTFNAKEMSELIDMALRYAEENGIVTDYWKDLLRK